MSNILNKDLKYLRVSLFLLSFLAINLISNKYIFFINYVFLFNISI